MSDQPVLFATLEDRAHNSPIRQCLDLVRRRKPWILLITLGLSLTIAVLILRLPNIYRAETVVTLVHPQKASEGSAEQTVTRNVDRLSAIRQEVMSPTRLGGLIKEMNLYPKMRGKVSDLVLIGRIIKSTSIEALDSGGQRPNSVRVAFTDTDREQVAPVANRLASLFVERYQKAREARLRETSQLLQSELEQTKHQLEEKEQLVQELKSRAMEAPPESKQSHLEAINHLREQLRRSQDQVKRDQQSKVYLQSIALLVAPTSELDQQTTPSKSLYQAELQKRETQLKAMQTRYGPRYPEVRKLRSEIEQWKAKAESEKPKEEVTRPQPAKSKSAPRNSVVEAELNKLDQDIADQTKIQGELEKQIQYHVEKSQQVPVFEQQIADLTRDYDTLQNHYNQLQAKKLDMDLSSQQETPEAAERLEILALAVPPDGPVGPKRGFLLGGGLLFGLLCGVGVAFLVEASDGSVRHEREAAQIFGKPVLAGIPKITSVRERIRSRLLVLSLTAGTAGAAIVAGLVLSRFVS